MSISLYGEQENGNLKLVAEVEGFDNPALAVDALLDDAPRLRDREFVAIDFEAGTLSRVTVDSDEPVNPKRSMTVTGFNGVVAEPEAAPRPRRQTRKASSSKKRSGAKKSTARKAPAKKAAAKKRSSAKKSTGRKVNAPRAGSARKPAVRSSAKKGGRKSSPFRTRPDDE